jgi:endonuclease/exonuclease/phosphatase family metal-dependent hydrolase
MADAGRPVCTGAGVLEMTSRGPQASGRMLRQLSIATFNCFGQAQGALDAITAWRAPHGARLRNQELQRALGQPDLVCVQEVMSRDAETFFDGLGLERVRDRNGVGLWPVTMRGSGLGIAGRVSLGPPSHHAFASPSSGWDRLARKGTLHVRVQLDGVELDVINLHLQSGYSAQAIAIRTRQIAEVAWRVTELGSAERTFLVCGDFNVCGLGGNGAAYLQCREALPGFQDLGAFEDLPTFDPHPDRNLLAHGVEPTSPCQRLDYIFLRPAQGGAPPVRILQVCRILDRPLRPPGVTPIYASDHFGLAATLEIG